MSVVTDVFVLVGDIHERGNYQGAEGRAPEVAKAIAEFIFGGHGGGSIPVISLMRDDWKSLQNGNKVAGSAAIWFGYNFADMEGLESHLKAKGFKHLTVWSHHEHEKGDPPRVVSF